MPRKKTSSVTSEKPTAKKTTSAEQVRATRLRKLFNLTAEEYDEILGFQGNACAITGQPSAKYVIDHDHKDGLVRGIIDWKINRALEMFKDNPDLLRRAADYLEHPTAPQALREKVYGVIGRVTKKAKNRRYGPDGAKQPQPRQNVTTKARS